MPAASLRIVADENMPALDLLSRVGEVLARPGRAIRPADLAAADVLLVRSVTRVDADLLAGTPVRFVGSATIGTDHIDTGWLRQAGIAFAHAPGCNAMAVAEYALQAVLDWVIGRGRPLAGMRIGVLGCGNVGSRVASLFRALGVEVLCCDPPRAQRGEPVDLVAVGGDVGVAGDGLLGVGNAALAQVEHRIFVDLPGRHRQDSPRGT